MTIGALGARETGYYTPRALIVALSDELVNYSPPSATPVAGRLLTTLNRLEHVATSLQLVVGSDGTIRNPIAEILVEAFGLTPQQAVLDSSVLSWHKRSTEDPVALRGALTLGAYALSAGTDISPRELLDHALPGVLIEVKDSCDRRGSIAAFAALVMVWLADLRGLLQHTLAPPTYEYADHVPPNASSPCGVLRLAASSIPRGPQPSLHIDAPVHLWALAA